MVHMYFQDDRAEGGITAPKMEENEDDQYFHPDSDDVEDLECYQVGGYHPVHIGDYFDNQRFKILHKLGSGGFATVWLARDTDLDAYVALKIHLAENYGDRRELRLLQFLGSQNSDDPARKYIPRLLHHFTILGPNGSHLCLVTTVAGPSFKELSRSTRRLSAKDARRTARQVTQALSYLHSLGVCHGDLTGANVLLQLTDINSWTEEQIYDRLGQPWIDTVERRSREPPGPAAPEYLVEPVEFSKIDSRWLTGDIQIIDFGEAFPVTSPPSCLGTPLVYLAPECFFERKFGVHSDVWALAGVIYMIRAARPLLRISSESGHADAVDKIVHMLGPLPQSWDNMSFDEEGMPKHGKPTDYAGNPNPWLEQGEKPRHPLVDMVRGIEAEVATLDLRRMQEGDERKSEVWKKPCSKNVFKPRNVRDAEWRKTEKYRSAKQETEEKERHANALKISNEEATSLYDLLNKILRYNPEERILTTEIERHEWFVGEFPCSENK